MSDYSVAMMGATGAVGSESLKALLKESHLIKGISTFGRRPVKNVTSSLVQQHQIDIFQPEGYAKLLSGHEVAICTLGVGQPSKISREDFVKIDKIAVLDFAKACKASGVQHFELLSSVGIDASSNMFFLRVKGELVQEIKALGFDRFSVFMPSMILTPTNRYGLSQAITLKIWPWINPLLIGGWKKYKRIKVEDLGKAMAKNIFTKGSGYEELTWEEMGRILNTEY